jgi:hypothetical protein
VPDDPQERVAFVRALALHLLLSGGVAGAGDAGGVAAVRCVPGVGRPEVIVVVDARAESLDADGRPTIDTGSALELHADSVAALLGRAVIHVVEVDDNQPVAPAAVANQGRRRRHASVAQRRLLRAVHPGCVVPGCRTRFNGCHIHHTVEWVDGGLTDLAMLVPLCPHHHAWLHGNGAWLELGPRRAVIVHLPDGRTLHWPAPSRAPNRAAPEPFTEA